MRYISFAEWAEHVDADRLKYGLEINTATELSRLWRTLGDPVRVSDHWPNRAPATTPQRKG